MKHIKLYEYNKNKYWTLPTDERYIRSLRQIHCPDNMKPQEFSLYNINYSPWTTQDFYNYMKDKNNNFIHIVNINNDWFWMPYNDKNSDEYFKETDIEYKGSVNIDPLEIIANKYNL